MKASKVLLNTKAKQAQSILMCEDGKMCASGVLLKRMGFSKEDLMNEGFYPDSLLQETRKETINEYEIGAKSQLRQNWFYSMVGSFYDGITEEIWRGIIARNDNGWSLKKIGKWLQKEGF